MRPLPLLLILLSAGLCFVAGYKVGEKNARRSAPILQVKAEAPQLTTASDEGTPAAMTAPITTPVAPPVATSIAAQPSDEQRFTHRAQQRLVTLTDDTDRTLVGEILEVNNEHLKIRRQHDSMIVKVPLTMLCQEDKAFASYLRSTEKGESQPISKSEEDKVWEEIFKGM